MENCMHLRIPENPRGNVKVQREAGGASPVNSLVKSLSKFEKGEFVEGGNFVGASLRGEVLASDGHVLGRFIKTLAKDLVEEG